MGGGFEKARDEELKSLAFWGKVVYPQENGKLSGARRCAGKEMAFSPPKPVFTWPKSRFF